MFKPDVRLSDANLGPWVIRILRAALTTAPLMQGNVVVVTSAADSDHGPRSLHPEGRAFDLRFEGIRPGAIAGNAPHALAALWCTRLRAWLGREYDVVLESDHIHIEYDPR
jgi:hypothetical protein